MAEAYATPDDLAALFGKSREWIVEQCRRGEFVHLRVGTNYRFKPKHVEEIEQRMERRARDADSDGRLPGVSPRSRSKYAKAPHA